MSFMFTRRSTKHVKKRLGSIQEELQKYFATADTLPEKTPDHLEPENAAQKRHSEENVHDELQRSLKTPSNLQRKVAFCPPRRRRAPLLRCNMADLKSVYTVRVVFFFFSLSLCRFPIRQGALHVRKGYPELSFPVRKAGGSDFKTVHLLTPFFSFCHFRFQ